LRFTAAGWTWRDVKCACCWRLQQHPRYIRKVPTFPVREAASLLGVSPDTVRRWAHMGRAETTTDAAGQLAVDGVVLARFAKDLAESVAATTVATMATTAGSAG